MKLSILIGELPDAEVTGRGDPEILGLAADSRQTGPGSLFIAVPGVRTDGHRFLNQAVERGAAALVVGKTAVPAGMKTGVPVVRVPDPRLAMGRVARRFYGHPSARLGMIGVTGTNGKTTVTYVIRSLIQAAGHRVGLLGTVVYEFGGEVIPATHTTPDSIALQGLLSRMVKKGVETCVMEVSSHALALDRTEGCEFDLGVFTNLSQDHLDFHATMENYFEAKRKLFTGLAARGEKHGSKRAVINRDDPWGARLLSEASVPAWSYGLEGPADLTARELRTGWDGSSFRAVTPAGSFPVRSSLVGRHNVYNLLAGIGAALHFEISTDRIREGLESLTGVPGRFERIESSGGFGILVDYAHTEAALDRLLRAVSELTSGRIITVFGCGGDRDRGKRAPMGRVAASLSNRVLITSDNPRSEDPLRIIAAVEAGAREGASAKGGGVEVTAVPDRRKAIGEALGLARPGDCVVIAGKGHETTQIIGDEKLPFDDRQVVRDWIQRTRPGGGVRGA